MTLCNRDPDELVRIPIFLDDVLNEGTPNECIVKRADNKVFKVIYAYGPITRWLLNTGWFDGKEK